MSLLKNPIYKRADEVQEGDILIDIEDWDNTFIAGKRRQVTKIYRITDDIRVFHFSVGSILGQVLTIPSKVLVKVMEDVVEIFKKL